MAYGKFSARTVIVTKFAGKCSACNATIPVGSSVWLTHGKLYCGRQDEGCSDSSAYKGCDPKTLLDAAGRKAKWATDHPKLSPADALKANFAAKTSIPAEAALVAAKYSIPADQVMRQANAVAKKNNVDVTTLLKEMLA